MDSNTPIITTVFVAIVGDTFSERFPIDVDLTKTVGHLKQLIKEANPTTLGNIDARKLKVWSVPDIYFYTGYGDAPVSIDKDSIPLKDPTEMLANVIWPKRVTPLDIVVRQP
ncbi:hypothetical protein EC957_001256 [Mortierella hygrophila]|uniref:Crinkler effector protein N-terminal domain-containing protein n=1 Tax=Mortierella hygrophila TaxID=979708 RepID=A0A9P6F5Z4_9FUNG|nr:hypothetical protein EC957_001256 [Mortierella hygrophila]